MRIREQSLATRRWTGSVGIGLLLLLTSLTSQAGTLIFFEASAGPGSVLSIPAPATSVSLDVNYDAASAEGGGFYGFSEANVITTGDVTIELVGLSCEAFSCLPAPFTAGSSVTMTGGDDLAGEFTNIFDILTLSVTGTNGYVAIVDGEYIDATGSGSEIGAVQMIAVTVLAEVPEPGLGLSLSLGCLALLAARRRRR